MTDRRAELIEAVNRITHAQSAVALLPESVVSCEASGEAYSKLEQALTILRASYKALS